MYWHHGMVSFEPISSHNKPGRTLASSSSLQKHSTQVPHFAYSDLNAAALTRTGPRLSWEVGGACSTVSISNAGLQQYSSKGLFIIREHTLVSEKMRCCVRRGRNPHILACSPDRLLQQSAPALSHSLHRKITTEKKSQSHSHCHEVSIPSLLKVYVHCHARLHPLQDRRVYHNRNPV